MSKISIIIRREYLTRVRKKSFIIMTLLTPLLIAALIVVPVIIMENDDKDFKRIAVIEDGSNLFTNAIPGRTDVEFDYLKNRKIDELKNSFEKEGYYGILYISPLVVNVPQAIQLVSKKQPPLDLLQHIERAVEKKIENEKLLGYNIENIDEILKAVKADVSVQTIRIDDKGEIKETNTGIAMALAYIGAFMMYMVVLMFGVQVMRGVFEEKNSRIVEVIISSVKPVQLMIGKIAGIALVGLTQFAVWIILTIGVVTVVKSTVLPDNTRELTETVSRSVMSQESIPGVEEVQANLSDQNEVIVNLFRSLLNVNWPLIIFSFIFYFIFGYLLYASVFAAIGSAVDTETDTQQFMFPIMLPIILGLFVAMGTMQNPESSLSFWFSIIPFTSPIVMMARIPFDVPLWEIFLSMAILAATFVGFVYMAAKIYRVGILMYGKKVSWKEMIKWIRYKS
ncbi:MAG TPA: ABC transporter permease [Bacteroidales bacterium]|nr:ABC transporter permease [Bacteroidales bacterium]